MILKKDKQYYYVMWIKFNAIYLFSLVSLMPSAPKKMHNNESKLVVYYTESDIHRRMIVQIQYL